MANISITALPAIASVTSTTIFPVVDVSGAPTTKKATGVQLLGGLPDATAGGRGIMTAAQAADLANAAHNNIVSTLVKRSSSGNFAIGTITANRVTGLVDPTDGSDAVNKTYADSTAVGLSIKEKAVAGTTANVTLAGGAPGTLDGVILVLYNRILVKNQTDTTQNGIYYVTTLGTGANGTWTRTTDADTGAELVTGSYVFISFGAVNTNSAYVMTTPGAITLGASAIVWNVFSQLTPFTTGGLILFTGDGLISSNTADGADNAVVRLNGGGAISHARGAQVTCAGNEWTPDGVTTARGNIFMTAGSPTGPGGGGEILLRTGDAKDRILIAANGKITFRTGVDDGTDRLIIEATGSLRLPGEGLLCSNTADGNDTSVIRLNGGGDKGHLRGAQVTCAGNEWTPGGVTTARGNIFMTAGSPTGPGGGGEILLRTGDAKDRIIIENDGRITLRTGEGEGTDRVTVGGNGDTRIRYPLFLGDGALATLVYDSDGNYILQKRFATPPTTLEDVIEILKYHGLCAP